MMCQIKPDHNQSVPGHWLNEVQLTYWKEYVFQLRETDRKSIAIDILISNHMHSRTVYSIDFIVDKSALENL